MADLVVITGGSHAGKTTVIRELESAGHPVVEEAAYEVIESLTDELGLDAQATWRREHVVEFQRRIAQIQITREQQARNTSHPVVFCDRGLFDGLAYCQLAGESWPDDLWALATDARYAHVFVLETLSTFDARTASGRIHSHADSVAIADLLTATYEDRADCVTRIPEMPVDQRVRRILDTHRWP